ncbi:MAG: hypothetical protein JNM59_01150 [Hyphomonadaceae bacterium]|nr:hypothetical protein [Hyphomonadaceae bacterium]
MKKLMGVALLAGASIAGAGAANAEVTANINLTSDYVFRGVSLSDNGPAVQGGFDYSTDMYYAGVWGSSIPDGVELDLYAGVTPTTGPIEWDLGIIGYFYPGADDDGAEFDYFEGKIAGSTALTEQFSMGGALYWAPENYGDTGDALYLEVNGEFAVSDAVSISGAFGNQNIEEPAGPGSEDDYNTWNLGGTFAMHGFEIDLRYHDTDIEAGSNIENYTYGPSSYDSAFVVTIGREL